MGPSSVCSRALSPGLPPRGARPGEPGARASLLQRTPVGEGNFLASNELQQHGLALVVRLTGALNGRNDFCRLFDALSLATHGPPQIGVMPADVTGAVALVRDHQGVPLNSHGRVVEDHGGDANTAAYCGLEIEPGHAKGRVTHTIHAELVGR